MIGFDAVVLRIDGLDAADLTRWIDNDWVRPQGPLGDWRFQEIDVARARLICELRDDLRIDEDTMPVVLLLLDQLYRLRRQMHELGSALERRPDIIQGDRP